MVVKAQQVAVTRSPTTALRQVAPQQVAPQQVAPGQFDISTLLASIMPLIMLVLMFQMLKPMLGGMAG